MLVIFGGPEAGTPVEVDPAAGPYVRFMFNSARLTPKASASAPVYGRRDALTDALVAA